MPVEAPVAVKIDWSKIVRYFGAISNKATLLNALVKGMKAGSLVLRIFMTENLSGRKIGVITGFLRRSAFVDSPRISGGVVSMSFGSRGVVYAAIHEFGGVIRAKRAPYLVFKPKGAKHYVRVKSVRIPERRPFRDAAERAAPGITQAVALQVILAAKNAGR